MVCTGAEQTLSVIRIRNSEKDYTLKLGKQISLAGNEDPGNLRSSAQRPDFDMQFLGMMQYWFDGRRSKAKGFDHR